MSYIEVIGTINQDGILEAKVPAGTPAGKVSVIIVVDPELEDDDDAVWDESFRKSKDKLVAMAKKAVADRKAGLTREIDFEVDLNEPEDSAP